MHSSVHQRGLLKVVGIKAYSPMNIRVCNFIVPRIVVGTCVTWSIVAIGHCCIPALAGVVISLWCRTRSATSLKVSLLVTLRILLLVPSPISPVAFLRHPV
ncbi:hypothetical protein BDD12DRAFT_834799, partial [Trichophaea hybrida]